MPNLDTISEGAVVKMKERRLLHNDGLARAVLEVIGHHQPIPTMDIWYELGEDERFEDGVALAEVKETLFHLENSKRIFREDGDKWMVKKKAA
jgi:hypothetical protein